MEFKSIVLITIILASSTGVHGAVVDFEEFNNRDLAGSGYAGLTWEQGLEGGGAFGLTGNWTVSGSYSIGNKNVFNGWGALFLGVSFNTSVDVNGAYFSRQGDRSTTGVRVHGYLDGVEISITDWFTDIDETNSWFAMNLLNVDRIVIESQPVYQGGGWYGMDDLTYNEEISAVPVPATFWLLVSGLATLIGLAKRKKLSINIEARY